MKILACDFSSECRSVALLADGVLVASMSDRGLRLNRGISMILSVLKTAGLSVAAVEAMIIGLGPGSYAGIRSAIAVGQGWQLARGIRLGGISSLNLVAIQAWKNGLRGLVGIVADAQRGEFYLEEYQLTETGWRISQPLRLASGADLASRDDAGVILVGPGLSKGEGERRFDPSASIAGLVSPESVRWAAGEELQPISLRLAEFVKAPPARLSI